MTKDYRRPGGPSPEMVAIEEKSAAKETKQGWYYDIRGGLHAAEIRLINRALREHLQTATAHKAKCTADASRYMTEANSPAAIADNFAIQQAQDSIDAIVRLSKRLLNEVELHNHDSSMRRTWMGIARKRGIEAADRKMLENMGWKDKEVK